MTSAWLAMRAPCPVDTWECMQQHTSMQQRVHASMRFDVGGDVCLSPLEPSHAHVQIFLLSYHSNAALTRTHSSAWCVCTQVFPGGAVDAADRASADELIPAFTSERATGAGRRDSATAWHPPLREGSVPPEAVIRTAACREAFEEAGVPLVTPQPHADRWARACTNWRARVHHDAAECVQPS